MSSGDSSPRYWDGRVRRVVAWRRAQRVSGCDIGQRVETLECGHTKVPWIKDSPEAMGHLRGTQYRVCFECPGMEPT